MMLRHADFRFFTAPFPLFVLFFSALIAEFYRRSELDLSHPPMSYASK